MDIKNMDVLGLIGGKEKLKHLEFVKTLVKAAMLILSWLYQFAKEKYHSFVIIPLYNKAKSIFLQVLSFLDIKVDEKAPANVKKVLERINEIFRMLSNLWSTIQIQIKLVGPQNAMKIFGTFIKDFIVNKLLPMLASKLFKFPGLSSAVQMAFPTLSFCSDKLNESFSKISNTIPGVNNLPKVPVPDFKSVLRKVEDAAAAAPTQIDLGHVTDGLTKAFQQVGVKPSENFIGDITKPFSEETQKNGNTPNIIEELTDNTLKNTIGLAPKEDDNSITEAN